MPRRIDERRLFEAVVELWTLEGYAGTTTRAIAARAGVNEATLFRRYGGKAQLVVAAIRCHLVDVPLKDVAATDDLRADLLAVVAAYQRTFEQVGAALPLLMIEAARHPELRPALQQAKQNLSQVVAVFVHHQGAGRLRVEEPMTAVMGLLGPLFVHGLSARVTLELPPLDVEGYVDGYLNGRRLGSRP